MSVECDDEGEERGGERSTDLCFFLWGGGPEPSWSDEVKRIQIKEIHIKIQPCHTALDLPWNF